MIRVVVRTYEYGRLVATTDVVAQPAAAGSALPPPRSLDPKEAGTTVIDLFEVDA